MDSRELIISQGASVKIGDQNNTVVHKKIARIGADAEVFVYGSDIEVTGSIGTSAKITFLAPITGCNHAKLTVLGDIAENVEITNAFTITVKGRIGDHAKINATSNVNVGDVANKVTIKSQLNSITAKQVGDQCNLYSKYGNITCDDIGNKTKLHTKSKAQITINHPKSNPMLTSRVATNSKTVSRDKVELKSDQSCWDKLKSCSLFSKAKPSATQSVPQARPHRP